MNYLCPSCNNPISQWVLIKKHVQCAGCGGRVKVADSIGMAMVPPVFLAGGLSYFTGNYYISGSIVLIMSVLAFVVGANNLKAVD